MVVFYFIIIGFYCFICLPTLNSLSSKFKPSVLFHSVIQSSKTQSSVKPTIVISHGLLGSTRNFRSFARVLSSKLNDEYDIVIIDLCNHGRSSLIGPLNMDYTNMALDLYQTLDHLNIRSCHLIGHSMGGKMSAMAALLNKKLFTSFQRLNQIKIQSLCMLDICPVNYSSEDFASVYDTVNFLVQSTPQIEAATNRNEVISIINNNISDNSLRAFLLTNIQENKKETPDGSTVRSFSWKLHVSEIDGSKESIAAFPQLDVSIYNYDRPTIIVKGANSTNFVRSIYLENVESLFPNFMVTTQRSAGHWLHADQPEQTADKIVQFIKYAEADRIAGESN